MFVRTEAIRAAGGYEPLSTSADLALWCRFARADRLGVIDVPLVAWRRHPQQIGADRIEIQQRTSVEVLSRHLEAMTGDDWEDDVVAALRGTGRWQRVGLRPGAHALGLWERAWRSDRELRPQDRAELARLTARVRLRHARMDHGADLPGLLATVARAGAARWRGAR
jgi:hypothetical protein